MIAFKEVENTLSKKVGDDADMTSIIEAVSQMNTSVPVVGVVSFESGEYSQLYSRGITVFLHGANNLDGYQATLLLVSCLHDLAKCSLAQEPGHLIFELLAYAYK